MIRIEKRNWLAYLMLTMVALVLGNVSVANARGDHDDDDDDDREKVVLCHTKTISIGPRAAKRHLKKHPNDSLGECSPLPTTCADAETQEGRPCSDVNTCETENEQCMAPLDTCANANPTSGGPCVDDPGPCPPTICGDDVVNHNFEECDGFDDAVCEGLCMQDCKCAADQCGATFPQCDGPCEFGFCGLNFNHTACICHPPGGS